MKINEFIYRPEKYDGPIAIDIKPSKECIEYHKNYCIQFNLSKELYDLHSTINNNGKS